MPTVAVVRPTADEDHEAVLSLVRLAFSRGHRNGEEAVGVVASTWTLGDSVDPIDLVAVVDDQIVGHVLGARGTLGQSAAIGVAPLSVTPSHQRQGVGTELMHELLQRASEAGWAMVVVLGSPLYYGRFGFEPSGPLGIAYAPVGTGNPHFQVRRLPSYDPSLRGQFTYCWERPVLSDQS